MWTALYNYYFEITAFALIQASLTINIEVTLIMYNPTQIAVYFTYLVDIQLTFELAIFANISVYLLLISSHMKSVDLFVRSTNKTIDFICSPKVYLLSVSN